MRTFIVDAFTDKPFSGNPAGVCILDEELSDNRMQHIAREINHSETAFLLKQNHVNQLRWFTPKREVDICGHATLALSHILYELEIIERDTSITYSTKSGILRANWKNEIIELDFPQLFVESCESNEIIEKAFDIKPKYIGKSDKRYLIEIDDAEKLKRINPNFNLLLESDKDGFMITAKSHDKYDFYSRFFAPRVGINEDPVTGSAHCYLAPYWSQKLNKTTLIGFQASERTGVVECEIAKEHRVMLRGKAITMIEMKMNWHKIEGK